MPLSLAARQAFPGLETAVRRAEDRHKTNLERLGKANYSWAIPESGQVMEGMFDYKDIPYQGTYGFGIRNVGVDESNILDRINLARNKFLTGDKRGGHQEIYDHMVKWGEQNNPALLKFLETNTVPEGVSMDTLLQSYDYGVRALGQKQQTKKPSFMANLARSVLPAVAGAFAAPLVGVGMAAVGAAGGAAGGAYRGVKDDAGLLGTLINTGLGGVGGYGIGSGLQGLTAVAPVGVTEAQQIMAINAQPTLTNVNTLMPADIAQRAATAAPINVAGQSTGTALQNVNTLMSPAPVQVQLPPSPAPIAMSADNISSQIRDRAAYVAPGDTVNPYIQTGSITGAIGEAHPLAQLNAPELTSINQLMPDDVFERSVTEASLLPENNVLERARATNEMLADEGYQMATSDALVDKVTQDMSPKIGAGDILRAADFISGIGAGGQPQGRKSIPMMPLGSNPFQEADILNFLRQQELIKSQLARLAAGGASRSREYDLQKILENV